MVKTTTTAAATKITENKEKRNPESFAAFVTAESEKEE